MTPEKDSSITIKGRGIFGDLMFSLVSTVIAAAILTGGLIYWYVHEKTNDELALAAQTYLTHLKDSLKGPLWNFNTQTHCCPVNS